MQIGIPVDLSWGLAAVDGKLRSFEPFAGGAEVSVTKEEVLSSVAPLPIRVADVQFISLMRLRAALTGFPDSIKKSFSEREWPTIHPISHVITHYFAHATRSLSTEASMTASAASRKTSSPVLYAHFEDAFTVLLDIRFFVHATHALTDLIHAMICCGMAHDREHLDQAMALFHLMMHNGIPVGLTPEGTLLVVTP